LSNLKYRQSIVKYAKRYSVTRASMNFNVSRTFIYKLISQYDGSLGSLKPYSNRPHHPRQSTDAEYQLIRNYIKRHPYIGLTILWIKLRQAGYKRAMTILYRSLLRLGLKTNLPKPKKHKVQENDTSSEIFMELI